MKNENSLKGKENGRPTPKKRYNLSFTLLIWIALLGFLAYRAFSGSAAEVKEIPYSAFKTSLVGGQITSVMVSELEINREDERWHGF